MRIAVLVSGKGTNLQALIDAEQRGELAPARIALVLSNLPEVAALERARKADIATEVVEHRSYPTRADFETALIACLDSHAIEAVVLAGFMRILGPLFVERYAGRILNTHPALCPSFPGINAPQQALDAGVKLTGCTVHLVDIGVDTGPIIMQEALAVQASDTASSLHARIQILEHKLLPMATQLLAAGKLEVSGRRVRIR